MTLKSVQSAVWVRRLLPILTLLGVLVVAGAFARNFCLGEFGRWESYRRLIDAFTLLTPDWRGWSFQGALGDEFSPSSLGAWAWCVFFSIAVWIAGCRRDKIFRPICLLASLISVVGVVGMGDAYAGIVVVISVAMSLIFLRIWHRDSALFYSGNGAKLKPLWTASTLGVLSCLGVICFWDASTPEELISIWSLGSIFAISLLISAAVAYVLCRKSVLSAEISGVWIVAVFTMTSYAGPQWGDFVATWRLRHAEWIRLVESSEAHDLRSALARSRMTEKEASIRRLDRPESETNWGLRQKVAFSTKSGKAEERLAAAWLSADETLYEVSGTKEAGRRMIPFVDSPGICFEEIEAWLLLESGAVDVARLKFKSALRNAPSAPMLWLGLGLATAGDGDSRVSVEALTVWCLLDPRAIFSPAWNRVPLCALRGQVFDRWTGLVGDAEFVRCIGRKDGLRLKRYAQWYSVWSRCTPDTASFIRETASIGPYVGAVALVRERILLTLENPTPEKVGASISAAAMLLADRHLNLGQCHEVFEAMNGRPVILPDIRLLTPPFSRLSGNFREFLQFPRFPPRAAVVVTRPMMPGWTKVCRFTEGGVGATLHDFEENLIVKILTYGRESTPVDLPEEWLRSQLPRP